MFIVKIAEPITRFGGIKQEIQEFKAEFDFLLVDLNNEIQTKFVDINKKLNEIENSIKSNITKQVDKNIISVNIIIALNLEHKLSQSEAHINNLDQYNSRNNASEDKVINKYLSFIKYKCEQKRHWGLLQTGKSRSKSHNCAIC